MGQKVTYFAFAWWAQQVDADSDFTAVLSEVNFPAVALLATSGVLALIFIARWMMKFQREFTNFYIDENNKLRARIDVLEEEIVDKDSSAAQAVRELLRFERESDERHRALQRTVDQHETTIRQHELTIANHELTIAELRRRLNDQ